MKPLDFQIFIDYKQLSKKAFKESYLDELTNDPNMLDNLKNLWDTCNLEETIYTASSMFPFVKTIKKQKYSYLYFFGHHTGDPVIYVISSNDPFLLKSIEIA